MEAYYFINKRTLSKGVTVFPSRHIISANNKAEAKDLNNT